MIRMVIGLALLVTATPALAQAPSAREKKQAEGFFRAGERAFNKGEYLTAAQAFEEAYRRFESPAIAFSAAQAYRLHYFDKENPVHLKRAVELYRFYLDKVPSGARRADAAVNLSELLPKLEKLERESVIDTSGTTQTGRVTKLLISSDVAAAKARVDGGPLRPMPLALEVKAGKHRVQVEAEGYQLHDETREVFAGQFLGVEVSLKPKPAMLSVKAGGGASVRVDGRERGRTPLAAPVAIDHGKHFVAVLRRGHEPFVTEVNALRGKPLIVEAELHLSLQRKISYGVFGAAGLSFLTAGGFAIAASSSDSKAAELLDRRDQRGLTTDELSRYERLKDERDGRLRTTYVFVGAGVVVGVAGALLYYLDVPMTSEQSPSVSPVVGDGQVGVGVSGSF